MTYRTRQLTTSALIVSCLALGLSACEVREELTEPDQGDIEIDTGTGEEAHPWVLHLPTGDRLEGTGNSVLPAMPLGDYRLTWNPTEDFASPVPNPVTTSLRTGSTAKFGGIYERLQGPKGHVVVHPVPADIKAPWTVKGPGGFYAEGLGVKAFRRRAVGEYTVVWGDVKGYFTPDPTVAMLSQDQTVFLTDRYLSTADPHGAVRIDITPNHLNPKWNLIGEDGVTYEGHGDSVLARLPLGEYTVIWNPVEGYLSPVPNPLTQEVAVETLTVFGGLYQEILSQPTGDIAIEPHPLGIQASWQLTGPDGFMAQGTGSETFASRALGEYTVVWEEVSGYTTPPPRTGTVEADATLWFDDTYLSRAIPTGTIAIDPDPDSILAPWSLIDSDGQSQSGHGDATLTELPVGDYTLTWGNVSGWDRPQPPSTTVTLLVDDTLTLSGSYEEIPPPTGTVMVEPTHPEATWLISGPAGFGDTGRGPVTYQGMTPGSYTVTWNPISGWDAPQPSQETQNLSGGATITFVGRYADPNGPSLATLLGGATNGASVTLDGDGFGPHTMDIASGVGPNGWIESNPEGAEFDELSGANGWDVGMTSPRPAVISTERAHSGSNSVLARIIRSEGYWQSVMRYTHQQNFDYIWVSFWYWMDPVYTSNSGYSQAKWFRIGDADANNTCTEIYTNSRWVGDNPGVSSADVFCGQTPSGTWDWDLCYDQIYDHEADEHLCESCSCGQAGPSLGACMHESSADNLPTPRQWTRVVVRARPSDLNVPNGEFFFSVSKPGQVEETSVDWSGVLTHSTNCTRFAVNPWKHFQFQNYFADSFTGDPNLRGDFFYDDLYLQFGTQARVELGDRAIYDNCTQLETQTPSRWSDGSIDFTMNHGAFSSGTTAYLFVVRDDGQVSSGLPVTLQ